MIEKRPAEPAPGPAPSLKHELRTPLNHIIGYCEMLTEEAQDCGLTNFLPDLERIHLAGRKLLAVVNEICEPAKLPAYRANPGLIDHDVRTPLNQIIGYAEMLQDEARAGEHRTFIADLERITAAARELLRRVVAHFAPVEDAAPGSDGLPEGATTIFRRATATPSRPPPVPALTGRLLVVDDDEGNRVMLARRLERLGHKTVLASNGREALQKLRAEPFDLLLLDIQMPEMNGYEVLAVMKDDAVLGLIPVIVLSASDETARVARCVEMGAEDYLPKPFDPVLLRARIGACLEKRNLRERERQAFDALKESQRILSDELAEAAQYVRSLLPAPLETGPVQTAWRFHPSTQLGGDAFSHHWLDEKHLAIFLLDVCGHGVGAALLSVSVLNTLANRTMRGVNFHSPSAVLGALNRTFAMEKQNNMFFTIWYGVYATDTRELVFASGGHPPAVLLESDANGTRTEPLRASGAIVGGFPEARYQSARRTLAPGSCLYVLSDGVYELARPDGSMVQFEDFTAHLAAAPADSRLDSILNWAQDARGRGKFEDDVSLLELRFA